MKQQLIISSVAFNIRVSPKKALTLLEELRSDIWLSGSDFLQNPIIHEQLQNTRYIRDNLLVLVSAGLVRQKRGKQGLLYQLSDLGQSLYQVQSTRPQLYADIIHYLFFTLYEEQQGQGIDISGWSWVYQATCRLLWDARPNVPTFPEQASILNDKLLMEYPEYTKGVYADSPNTAVVWLRELQPPFLQGKGKSCKTYSRSWCSPELLVLGIDRLYRRAELPYNTPLLLVEQIWSELSQLCLMEVALLEEVLEVARSTFSFLKVLSGEWGLSVILERAIIYSDVL
ncbi:hypothetical protein [Ktedonobacter robiniae]|uniref:DUF4007 domain-containing protein n=1 Tax=Ktedonobacter robiniae TaxID=2778365 RepID=A0ABQ3UTK8_9CHLR|nr:hypothetical protein [Ktedonobacter robiniae]GHO56033.1 hypothetical protein KSB_45080 [Ktedonobacter robiniae]